MRRDYPNLTYEECTCYLCNQLFQKDIEDLSLEWDHLVPSKGSSVENSGWSHRICNRDKENNIEWQVIAAERLKRNIRWADTHDPQRQGELGKKFSEYKETSDESDVSVILYKNSVLLLNQRLLPQNGRPAIQNLISMKEAAECVDFMTKEESGRGSQAAAQRHLETLSCSISPKFEKRLVGGKWFIFRREGQ